MIADEALMAPIVTRLSESAEETLKNLSGDDINLEFGDEESAEKTDDIAAIDATTRW